VDTSSATHVSKSKYVTVSYAIPNTLPSEDMAKEIANQLGKLQHLGAQYVGPNHNVAYKPNGDRNFH
jgi:hypothetical protein